MNERKKTKRFFIDERYLCGHTRVDFAIAVFGAETFKYNYGKRNFQPSRAVIIYTYVFFFRRRGTAGACLLVTNKRIIQGDYELKLI